MRNRKTATAMKSCAIFTAFVLFLTQQWPQVSASRQYDSEEYSCLNYDKCCYYANEYYYKCVAADDCGRGDPYYCRPFYDDCSDSMEIDAPIACKACLNDYYRLSDGLGCACCAANGYCDDYPYTPPQYYD